MIFVSGLFDLIIVYSTLKVSFRRKNRALQSVKSRHDLKTKIVFLKEVYLVGQSRRNTYR